MQTEASNQSSTSNANKSPSKAEEALREMVRTLAQILQANVNSVKTFENFIKLVETANYTHQLTELAKALSDIELDIRVSNSLTDKFMQFVDKQYSRDHEIELLQAKAEKEIEFFKTKASAALKSKLIAYIFGATGLVVTIINVIARAAGL